MSTSTYRTRKFRWLAAAGAFSAALALGAGTAAAADEHSGGVAPNTGGSDPGAMTVEPAPASQGSSLPVTGGDVAGLVALGAVSVAAGSVVVVASKRRAHLSV